MKFSFIVLVVCLAALAQSKESAAPPAGVPAGAVSTEAETWRWVDKDGKAWLYRATPFGIMRSEEPKLSAAKRPAGVPADAVSISAGHWRWIDPQRKIWVFQETPTGLMKLEEPKAAVTTDLKTGQTGGVDTSGAALDAVSVKEEGDSLRFSRPGPFGRYTWVKKKTQLDKDETIVWQRAQTKPDPAKKD